MNASFIPLIVKRAPPKTVREGRENRKKSTATASVSGRRSHEAFGVLKEVTFLTYTVTPREKTAPTRVTTSPEGNATSPGEVSTSPGLVLLSPGLVATRRTPRFSPSEDYTP
jgi:hypothetical protein